MAVTLSITSVGDSSFTVTLDGFDPTYTNPEREVTLSVFANGEWVDITPYSFIVPNGEESITVDIWSSNVSFDKGYLHEVVANILYYLDAEGTQWDSVETNVETFRLPPSDMMASVLAFDQTSAFIEFSVSDEEWRAYFDNLNGTNTYTWYVNGINVNIDSASGAYVLTDLSPNTSYDVEVYCFVSCVAHMENTNTVILSFTTLEEDPRPLNWSWSSACQEALQNKGRVSTLTYTEWNSFVDRVREFLEYKNKSTLNIGNAKMTSSDKVMTAVRFNIVRESVDSMRVTGISEQNRGDPVLGSYFIILANTLNGVE